MRLFTRNGYDWTRRFPWIVKAALKNREQQFVIDGEAVVLGVDGASDFNALPSRRPDNEVQLYAFDILAVGGEDLRHSPMPSGSRTGASGSSRGCLPRSSIASSPPIRYSKVSGRIFDAHRRTERSLLGRNAGACP